MTETAESKIKCNLLPRGNRVIVKKDEHKYTGKLVIPDKYKTSPSTGHIIAVGPEIEINAPDLKIGKRVLYGQFSGIMVQMKGHPQYIVLSPDEIVAEVTEDGELDYTAAG